MVNIITSKTVPKDAIINAPPAQWRIGAAEREIEKAIKSIIPGLDISAEEIVQLQKATIRELESNLDKTRIVATTIANAALCLYKMLLDEGYTVDGESVVFPKELVDKMKGAEISVAESGTGDRSLRITARSNHPVWEGRQKDHD
jgi:hypothetical protein